MKTLFNILPDVTPRTVHKTRSESFAAEMERHALPSMASVSFDKHG